MARIGRPPNPIPSELLAVRVPRPIFKRFRKAARASGMGVGEFMAALLDKALPKETKR